MCKTKRMSKQVNRKSEIWDFFHRIALLAAAFMLLTSCKAGKERLELPGQLLLRDNGKLVIVDGSGSVKMKLDSPGYGVRWSFDGKYIVFRDSSEFDFRVLELETGHQVKILEDQVPFYPHFADWSPTGQEVALMGALRDENTLGLYIADIIGTSPPYLTWKCEYWCRDFQWSSDGQHIIISENLPRGDSGGLARVIKVNIRTGQAALVFSIDRSIDEMRWNPVEERVAIVSYGEGTFLLDKDGQEQLQIVPDDVGDMIWSPDGKWLAFNQEVFAPKPRTVVNVYNVETGEIQRLHPRDGGGNFLISSQRLSHVLGWRE
jgi:Tol biopolymer transport system component